MDTLLETANRRHSRMALMAARSRSMPPSALRQAWSPERKLPASLESARNEVLSEKGEPSPKNRHSDTSGSYHIASRRTSRLGKSTRSKKKSPLVILLQTDGNSSRYSLVRGNELVKVGRQRADLEKPLPPSPSNMELSVPVNNAGRLDAATSQDMYRQSEFDLEAQKEKIERNRFWILAVFTVITGLGTIILVLIEVSDFFSGD
ncbi:hypothetical protein PFICI_14536 [Pestalotiopsis fici W106-1]|uniref:Uncharacterized protein n=1 Tax=Pestalotiopsis fici (strain W106-1 / CGMCC3.15140) TaxID=1229662 RepID=W3WI29_PESFW|nr:uncharacterized protein PFICI_14536 [Pestalotiopsis fici W106-1]ETS73590.1 hypothetical protein PFICI_14536 [Pestalotiopsis fici W106-1]